MTNLIVRPWTIKQALPWISQVHRRLPYIQGGRFALRLDLNGVTVGCALIGSAARMLGPDVLCVCRVDVQEGIANGCSMLYGASSRTVKNMGALGLVTYTHTDEPGTSLRAAGWITDGLTSGGEHSRVNRPRRPATDAGPKRRWWTPWSKKVLILPQDIEDSFIPGAGLF